MIEKKKGSSYKRRNVRLELREGWGQARKNEFLEFVT